MKIKMWITRNGTEIDGSYLKRSDAVIHTHKFNNPTDIEIIEGEFIANPNQQEQECTCQNPKLRIAPIILVMANATVIFNLPCYLG